MIFQGSRRLALSKKFRFDRDGQLLAGCMVHVGSSSLVAGHHLCLFFTLKNKPSDVASLSFFGTFTNRDGGVTDFSDSVSRLCCFLSAHWSLASISCILWYGPWATEQTAFIYPHFSLTSFHRPHLKLPALIFAPGSSCCTV